MPEKGFTATFISNTGKTLRQFDISGWKLYLARVVLALVVLLLSAAVVIVAYGFINAGESDRLREEISHLQDSLAQRRTIEARIEVMETRLQYLEGYRKKLENLACLVSAPEDSLE
jgi:Tfp pilus assembly protein PilO